MCRVCAAERTAKGLYVERAQLIARRAAARRDGVEEEMVVEEEESAEGDVEDRDWGRPRGAVDREAMMPEEAALCCVPEGQAKLEAGWDSIGQICIGDVSVAPFCMLENVPFNLVQDWTNAYSLVGRKCMEAHEAGDAAAEAIALKWERILPQLFFRTAPKSRRKQRAYVLNPPRGVVLL